MKRWALIVNNQVDLVVEQETIPEIEGAWVECTNVSPGDSYVENEFVKNSPIVSRKITVLAFLSRFTDEEAIAIDLASIGATVEAATLRRYMQKVNAAKFIDLDREDTIAGVTALETAGILSAGRASVILNSQIQDIERV